MRNAACFLFLVFTALTLRAYDLLGRNGLRWAPGDIPMSLQLDATMAPRSLIDGKDSWDQVAREALEIWNGQLSDVRFTATNGLQRGDGDNRNEVFFSTQIFNHSFGDGVLAVTTAWKIGSERVEGDTVLNSAIDWDSYRGPLEFFAIDLRRVLTHEFGHTLGLDHPDEAKQVVVALMNSTVSDLDTVALDDIRGVRALYPPDAKYALNIDIVPPGAGTVTIKTPPDGDGKYPAGTMVKFLAKPQRRFRFNFWSGDEDRTGRKLTVRVVDNESIALNFSTNGAPVIRSQPQSQIAFRGETISFSVRAASHLPATYQWQHDGSDLPGATEATLVLNLSGHENSGLYSVRVTNARGETFSKPARLVVDGY